MKRIIESTDPTVRCKVIKRQSRSSSRHIELRLQVRRLVFGVLPVWRKDSRVLIYIREIPFPEGVTPMPLITKSGFFKGFETWPPGQFDLGKRVNDLFVEHFEKIRTELQDRKLFESI